MDREIAADIADAVLDRLLAGEEPRLRTLRRQRERADRAVRVTGAGLFVEFTVPEDCETLPPDSAHANDEVGGVEGRMDGLEYGLGFVLFVRDGRLSLLEGYTYEESLPEEVTDFTVVETEGGGAGG